MIEHYLKISLLEGKKIKIIYQKDNELTERIIKVYKIQKDKVEAYCYLRKAQRIFKKKNILAAEIIKIKDKR